MRHSIPARARCGPCRRLVTGLAATGLALLALGCTRDDHEDEDQPPAPRPLPSASISDGVISAQLLSLHRNPAWAEALVRIENDSADPVELVNLGDTLTGFSLRVDGVPTSASTVVAGQPVAAASLTTLPAQVPVELALYWKLAQPAHGDDYPCTLAISNLFQKGRRLPDVIIQIDGRHRRSPTPSANPHGAEDGAAPAAPGNGVSM